MCKGMEWKTRRPDAEKTVIELRHRLDGAYVQFMKKKYSSAGYEACKVMKDAAKLMFLLIPAKGVKKKTAYQIIMQVKDFLNLLDEKLIKNQR